jgi:hypothetical protein
MAVSVQASEEGLKLVDDARQQLGWYKSQPEWIEKAGVSTSALRRFWLGHPIKKDSFIAICTTAGVGWRDVVDNLTAPSTRMKLDVMMAAMAEIVENPKSNDMNKINAAQAYASLVIADVTLHAHTSSLISKSEDPDQPYMPRRTQEKRSPKRLDA